jgi:SAM-dependent methyltransferase
MDTVPPVPPVLPPQALRFMNETDETFVSIGQELARLLYSQGLGADSRLLDVGSGYGRLAVGLMSTGYEGRYLGFDILPRHVKWCRRNLMGDERYRFRHLDVHNARYNPQGQIASRDARFPTPDRSVDLAALFSVFTHFYADDIRHYLSELRRVLVPGGHVVATCFVYDEARLPAVTSPDAAYPLVHVLDEVTRFESLDDPLKAIGFEESFVRRLVAEAGFELVSLERGSWARDGAPEHYQDLMVLRKPVPPPPSLLSRVRRRVRRALRGRA